MTIIENLNKLENNINTAKTNLQNNLTAKGVSVQPNNTLTEMADLVNSIPSGGGGGGSNFLESIGYSDTDPMVKYTEDQIAYSKHIQDVWNKNGILEDGCISKIVYFPKIDLSGKRFSYKFQNASKLVSIPDLDFTNCTSKPLGQDLFWYCKSLSSVGELKGFTPDNLRNTFYNDSNLEYFPKIDTSYVRNWNNTFNECSSLKEFPNYDFSSATNMSSCFCNCVALTSVPKLVLNKVTTLNSCFKGCSDLVSVESIICPECTNMYQTFNDCRLLERIGPMSFGSVTDMSITFNGCLELVELPPYMDTKNVREFYGTFSNTSPRLEFVPDLDFTSATNTNSMFIAAKGIKRLKITNLGTQPSCTSLDLPMNVGKAFDNGQGSEENLQALRDTLTGAFDRATAGYSTFNLGGGISSLLTESEIAAFTAKGYTIA